MQTGKVKSHAIAILLMVFVLKFLTPLEATMLPAIPLLKICVVLTGKPN